MTKKITPIKKPKAKTKPKCSHNLVPYEYHAGKQFTLDGMSRVDWGTGMLYSNLVRLKKLICTKCKQIETL